MTAEAIPRDGGNRRPGCPGRFFVARGTRKLCMRPIQYIACLPGVVEVPRLPAARVVAQIALSAKRAFMHIFRLVALATDHWRVFVFRCFVA